MQSDHGRSPQMLEEFKNEHETKTNGQRDKEKQ